MRDPERIGPALAALETYWKANPDMRLGQIIENASRFSPHPRPTFYIEDDLLLEGLQVIADA